MADTNKTRSCQRSKELFGNEYKEVTEYEAKSKLPTGAYLMGRMLHLCRPTKKGTQQRSKNEASVLVAGELRADWIHKNVYPKTERAVAKQINEDYQQFLTISKHYRSSKPKAEKWLIKANNFNDSMTLRGYDIRTTNREHQHKMESETGVKMTEEDEKFYLDNCKGDYIATCTATVPESWRKKKKREYTRTQSAEKKQNIEKERKETESARCLEFHDGDDDIPFDEGESTSFDKTYEPLPSIPATPTSRPTRSTRSMSTPTAPSQNDVPFFPEVKTRTGRQSLNENLVRCIAQCVSEFKVSHNDLAGIMVRMANMVFEQRWTLSGAGQNADDDDEVVSSCDEDDDDQTLEPSIKRRKTINDLTLVFPSRRCVATYIEDAYFLNLKVVADHLLEKEENVVTVGVDDTTKAAGHKLYDIKSDHITVDGPGGKKILTTGFTENISHSGQDSAKSYEHNLQILALLADSTVDDLKNAVDFWITDRAADCDTFLDELGIDDAKILKCCGHLILGVDNACDKVFRNAEQRIGVQNLLSVNAGDKVFCSPSSSIHTLGEIAIAKLLSPSHAAHSVSLYPQFISWLEEQGEERRGFKGFTSNRFGRIAEIACQFLKMKELIRRFFDAVVDTNSNKLILAVSTYIQSDWFVLCCELYEKIGDILIFPLMDLLGIDQRGHELKASRNWNGVKDFFKMKLTEMNALKDNLKTGTGKDRLMSAMLEESVEALTRQLSKTPFFNEVLGLPTPDTSELPDPSKLKYAPLSNLGCESEFAWFNNRVKISGGTESVESISRKNVISTNGLLVDSGFWGLSNEKRLSEWKSARSSTATLEARKLQRDFIATLKQMKKLALAKREAFKLKKKDRLLKTIDICKLHGGPITPTSLHMLNNLSDKELLSEVLYLRLTIAPDIRQQRRVKDASTGRFRVEKFTSNELKNSIKNALKPEDSVEQDMDRLLMIVFSDDSNNV